MGSYINILSLRLNLNNLSSSKRGGKFNNIKDDNKYYLLFGLITELNVPIIFQRVFFFHNCQK